ncbi:MAG: hypothetical protein K9H49_03080 [Bacteroidales bacterium]|nr:hypothetical protein [Bacteroidales bacterium]MCF8389603.1 hypothetical protein [Bacteroidales bacterium]
MLKKIAQSFSITFHPLLMPTIGIVLLLYTDSYLVYIPAQAKNTIILLIAIGTLVLPFVILPIFLLQGKINNLVLDERKERIYPLVLTSMFYFLTYILFQRIPIVQFLHAYIFGAFLSVFAGLIISLKWKISTHMIGLGGLTGLVAMASINLNINLYFSLIGVIIATGLTGSSRIYLEAHSPAQVYAGYFAGFIIMIACLSLY